MKKQAIWPGWETTRLIGRGSFGAVYEIQRDVFGETEKAALKVISIPQNESDIREMLVDGYDEESITSTFAGHLKNIVTEYSLMRKMNGSSNVVNCDDFRYEQHEDGVGWDIFIKMELLTPIADILPARVSEEQVIKIGMDMCAALELCSKHNIVHRDIKPQNIFVSENGDYKLGDFGIAKTVEKTMGGTKTGTYKYMAPEVYSNKPYNSTADIYSLGLVLYWMLNERRMPFMPLPPEKLKAGMDEESRSRRFSGEKIPAPKRGSEELKRIVLKACAFDPKDRYQSAREMREDLMRLSGGQAQEFIPELQPTPILNLQDDTDDNKTVGPIFNHASVVNADGLDKTVGPVFDHNVADDLDKGNTIKPNTQNKKQKGNKTFGVVAALLAVGVLCSFLFFGKDAHKNADKDTAPISSDKKSLIEYVKDEQGQTIKTIYRRTDGTVAGWYESERNESGVEIERTMYDTAGNKLSGRSFRADGSCYASYHTDSPGQCLEYDNEGNLLLVSNWDGEKWGHTVCLEYENVYNSYAQFDPGLIWDAKYFVDREFDEEDNITMIKYIEDGVTIQWKKYEYSASGVLMKEIECNPWDGSVIYYQEVTYNERINTETRTAYDPEGNLLWTKDVIFNDDGKIYMEVQYNSQKEITYTVMYYYYDQGDQLVGKTGYACVIHTLDHE